MISDSIWTIQQAAEVWGVSVRRATRYCEEGRIKDVERIGKNWIIPINTEKPKDERFRSDFVSNNSAKPFIKWAGGKGQLLESLRYAYPRELGKDITKYAEPFIGGGAVLFDILNNYPGIEEAYISDINAELITTYKTIRDDVDKLIEILDSYQKNHLALDMNGRKEYFIENRNKYNEQIMSTKPDTLIVASLFIYLNKTCFNGLYRVNSRGLFNVPSGVYKNPMICDADNLRVVSEKLQKVRIENKGYAESYDFIDENTFVYFDPPYRPLTESSSFTSYTEFCFNDDDQRALADYVHRLCDKGVKVAVSNSDPKNVNPEDNFFDDLYNFATVHRVQANRMINSKGTGRGKISEILVTNYDYPELGEVTLDSYP